MNSRTTTTTTTTINSNNNNNIKTVKIKYSIDDIVLDLESFQKSFECSICYNYIVDFNNKTVKQCNEGHIACSTCWEKSLQQKKECMQCKIPVLSFSSLPRNRYLEKDYFERIVQCPYSILDINKTTIDECNSKDSDNTTFIKLNKLCNKSIKIEELENHLKECPFQILKCNCGLVFRKNQSDEHQRECLFQLTPCKYCHRKDIQKCKLDEHLIKCKKSIKSCSLCGTKLEGISELNHLESECAKVISACEFPDCDVRLPRFKLHQHSMTHIGTLITTIKELQIANIETNKKLEQSKINIDKMVSVCNDLREELENGKLCKNIEFSNIKSVEYKWFIYKYKEKSRQYSFKESFTSDVFNIGPYRFYFDYYPFGYTAPGYVSIFLFSEREYDVELEIKLNIEIFGSLHIESFSCSKNITDYSVGFGTSKLVKTKSICNLSKGYIDKAGNLLIFFDVEILNVSCKSKYLHTNRQ